LLNAFNRQWLYGNSVRDPANGMIGNIHHVSLAPRVRAASTMFIAAITKNMEINGPPMMFMFAASVAMSGLLDLICA
jgi:hypothetical protein